MFKTHEEKTGKTSSADAPDEIKNKFATRSNDQTLNITLLGGANRNMHNVLLVDLEKGCTKKLINCSTIFIGTFALLLNCKPRIIKIINPLGDEDPSAYSNIVRSGR